MASKSLTPIEVGIVLRQHPYTWDDEASCACCLGCGWSSARIEPLREPWSGVVVDAPGWETFTDHVTMLMAGVDPELVYKRQATTGGQGGG